jgi:acyl-coenzyme A thioesterase PaaI-like protein
MCFVCGVENMAGLRLRFFDDGPKACRAIVMIGQQHQGYPGVAHGGIVAAMLDEAMGRAAMSGNTERFMFTAKIEVRYRQHVPLDRPLTLVARLEKDRGRLATASAELRLEDGSVAAEASAMLAEVPPQELAGMEPERLGWKVYP